LGGSGLDNGESIAEVGVKERHRLMSKNPMINKDVGRACSFFNHLIITTTLEIVKNFSMTNAFKKPCE